MRDGGLVPSTGAVGDCYDNALAERFFATLECERLDRRRWPTPAAARLEVFDYLEGFYNPHRRHSALGQLSPAEYEGRWQRAHSTDVASWLAVHEGGAT